MDPTYQILARLGTDNPPTDEELASTLAEFKALGRNAVQNAEAEEAASLRQAIEVLEAEIATRAEAQAERDAQLAELAAVFQEEDGDDEDEEADEDDETEATVEAPEFNAEAAMAAARNARARVDAAAVPENPYPHIKVRGMGQAEAESMVALLLKLKKDHAIMLVEHDMDAVFTLADRLTVMVNGQVIASGTPAEVRADATVQAAYLGEEHA